MKPRKRAPAAIRLSKSELAAAKALSRFRPSKKQVQSFVFIGLNGKPLPRSSRKKGIMTYVYKTRSGKLKSRPVRQIRSGARQGPIRPLRSSSYDLPSTGKKTALSKYYKGHRTNATAPVTIRPTRTERSTGINYTRFSGRLAKDLRSFVDSFRSRGQFLIEVSFTIRLPSGQLETHNATIGFSQAEAQHLRSSDYEKFIRTKVYRFIAETLAVHDLVTAGSARHIRSLAANRGVPRSDWVDRRGEEWSKADFQTVKLMQMSYKLIRV